VRELPIEAPRELEHGARLQRAALDVGHRNDLAVIAGREHLVRILHLLISEAALMDLELTPFNYEAEAYACLSRAALTSVNVLRNPTITSIETLVRPGLVLKAQCETDRLE